MCNNQALKEELEKMGIHTQKELKEAMKKTSLNISIMAAGQKMVERLVG